MDFKADLCLVLIAFVMAIVAGLIIIPCLRRLKAGQSILKYVDMHAAKNGTPTMGGLIFILPIVLISLVFIGWDTPLSLIIVVASCAYAIVGFLDDFLKIKHHQNLKHLCVRGHYLKDKKDNLQNRENICKSCIW